MTAELSDISALRAHVEHEQHQLLITELTHDHLVVLTRWMATIGYEASSLADAIEKPWKWLPEIRLAIAVHNHETANDGHTCLHMRDLDWYCNDCDWTLKCECPSPGIGADDCPLHKDA